MDRPLLAVAVDAEDCLWPQTEKQNAKDFSERRFRKSVKAPSEALRGGLGIVLLLLLIIIIIIIIPDGPQTADDLQQRERGGVNEKGRAALREDVPGSRSRGSSCCQTGRSGWRPRD